VFCCARRIIRLLTSNTHCKCTILLETKFVSFGLIYGIWSCAGSLLWIPQGSFLGTTLDALTMISIKIPNWTLYAKFIHNCTFPLPIKRWILYVELFDGFHFSFSPNNIVVFTNKLRGCYRYTYIKLSWDPFRLAYVVKLSCSHYSFRYSAHGIHCHLALSIYQENKRSSFVNRKAR
jgi:hypothetical protein